MKSLFVLFVSLFLTLNLIAHLGRGLISKTDDVFSQLNKVVENLELDQISELDDLIKLIRNDLKKKPEKAKKIVNSWFDSNTEYYVEQILLSELGSHQDQNKIYDLFTPDRKVKFFKRAIQSCLDNNQKGFNAGSFMLGRFIIYPI